MCLEEALFYAAVSMTTVSKRYSVSSFRVKSWDLCRARMRVNAQEEKQKHGIAYDLSSPLEKGRAEGAG